VEKSTRTTRLDTFAGEFISTQQTVNLRVLIRVIGGSRCWTRHAPRINGIDGCSHWRDAVRGVACESPPRRRGCSGQ
jgi:hypothetical protein